MRLIPAAFVFLAVITLGTLPVIHAQEQSSVRFEKGRVTASVRNSPIRTFLEELAVRAHIAIVPAEEIGDDTVSVELNDVPLEEALRTVLDAYDSFFYYESGKGRTHSLRSVWVYPTGAGKGLRPVPPSSGRAPESWKSA